MSEGAATATTELPAAHEGVGAPLCPACGYVLVGLPRRGICPECGRAYAEDLIVLHGYARGMGADASTGRPKSLVWFGLLAAFQVAAFLPQSGLEVWAFVVFVIVSFGLKLWGRRSPTHPGTVQARFNRHGCVQHRNPLDPMYRMAITLLLVAWSVFWVAQLPNLSAMPIAVWVFFAFLFLVVLPIAWWQHRRQRAAAKRGLLDDLTDDQHRALPTSWRDTGQIVTERVGPGRYRLQVSAKRAFLTVALVDIEAEATDEHIAAIVRQLQTWQEQGNS
jgi:hypothetical protein